MATNPHPVLTAPQCRAARALVSAKQEDVAAWSGVSKGTIAGFEMGKRQTNRAILTALRQSLEAKGVRFMDPDDRHDGGVYLIRYGSALNADPSDPRVLTM